MVGSDRTTSRGDVCNKIGTYLKALSAFDNNVPFYVAVPRSTIDFKINDSRKIPIEIRSAKELSHLTFKKQKKISTGEIYFRNSNNFNPAFDVTPAKYITKLITENGLIEPKKSEIMKNLLK